MTSTGPGMERQTSLFWQQHFQNESEDDQDKDDEVNPVRNSDDNVDYGSTKGGSGGHAGDDDCGSNKSGDDDDDDLEQQQQQQQGGTTGTGAGPTTTTTTTTTAGTNQDGRLQSKQREVAARNSVSSTLLQAEKRRTSYPMLLLPPDSEEQNPSATTDTNLRDEEEGSEVSSPAVLLVGAGSNRHGSSLLELQHEKLSSQGLSASVDADEGTNQANEGATRTSRVSGLSSYLAYLSGSGDDDSPPSGKSSAVSAILGGTPALSGIAPLPEMMNVRRGPGAHSVGAGFRPTVGVPLVEAGNGGGGSVSVSEPEEEAVTNVGYNNNEGLAEAMPVSEYFPSMEAMPVDQKKLDQLQALKEAKEKRFKRSICGLVVVVAFLALVLSLSLGQNGKDKDLNDGVVDTTTMTETPTPSPTRTLPPMESLELLYYNLPGNTKESLYDIASPQYQAWEWLLNHPNITTYPEWRKKQVFAMATFYYALEGPNWPEETPGYNRWMNTSISECDWVLSDAEVQFWTTVSYVYLGPTAHQPGDFQPCNSEGELQTLMVQKLFLPNTDVTPIIPPEIELLSSSLQIFGILTSQFHAKLSDLLIPEVIQLSKLQSILFYGNGVMSGTMPMEIISQISGLRHLLISSNKLTGIISSQIGRMTSLEHLMLDDLLGVTGTLPSELGLMTSLTALEIYRSSVTGTIPTELGSLSNNSLIYLDGNRLTGTIPTQLGLRPHG